MPKVQSQTKQRFAKKAVSRKPLWDGPESNTPQGGCTQSLLARFLTCRERFRIHVIEGLRPIETWNQRLGYGEMWHICEEAFAGRVATGKAKAEDATTDCDWVIALNNHLREQCKKYPLQQEMIYHWYRVCLTQFPIYIKYWSKNKDVLNRTPLLQEQAFNVPYRLPSGRIVYIRGKWDSVDLVKRGKKSTIVLKENKTKGDIDEVQLQNQLLFDMQSMVYLVALEEEFRRTSALPGKVPGDIPKGTAVSGISYNVVRRPLSGGTGSIVQGKGTKGAKCGLKSCKDVPDPSCPKCEGTGRVGAKPPESDEEYYGRLRAIIDGTAENSPGPEYFFMRWSVEIFPSDIEKFKTQFLNPCLEQLCDWYEHVSWAYKGGNDPFQSYEVDRTSTYPHFRSPFGIWNPLVEGGATDLDSYLAGGDGVGLVKAETLFRELE